MNFVANLKAPEQKVSISLQSLINVCKYTIGLSSKVTALKKEIYSTKTFFDNATSDMTKLATDVMVYKGHVRDYLNRIKSEEDRFESLRVKYAQLLGRKQMLDEDFEKVVKESANKDKDLADSRI